MTKFNEIKKYIILEVVVPAIKEMVLVIGQESLRTVLFPNSSSYEYSYDRSRIRYNNTPVDKEAKESDEKLPELTEVIAESLRKMRH